MNRTNRALPMTLWGSNIVLPAGTPVRRIENASGAEGDLWAVDNVKQLIDLTGNTHDPKYRYAFVPADAVTEA